MPSLNGQVAVVAGATRGDLDGKRPDHAILDEASKKAMASGFLAAMKRDVWHAWEVKRLDR